MENTTWASRMRRLLEASQLEEKEYFVRIYDKDFVVYPNVFSPMYFPDAELFVSAIPFTKGSTFLEIGCGTGVISIFAAIMGCSKIFSVDINPDAILNTIKNVELHNVSGIVTAFQSDVYDSIPPSEKFDIIFWNVPFGFTEHDTPSILERSVFDKQYLSIERFFAQATKYLNKKGRLLFGFSTTLGRIDLVKRMLDAQGYRLELISQMSDTELDTISLELFEVVVT